MKDELDPWLELRLPAGDTLAAAPMRYAVPAHTLTMLELGQLVTFGQPGGWWIVDQAHIASEPIGTGEQEEYLIMPQTEFAALALRPNENAGRPTRRHLSRSLRLRTNDLWVYRDAETNELVTDVAAWNPEQWFTRMPSDDLTPPPTRQPRPARELPSLIGHRLWTKLDGQWVSGFAVSEPLAGEEITVKMVPARTYYGLLGGQELPERQPYLVELTRLWSY
jgi:hypothetical protein